MISCDMVGRSLKMLFSNGVLMGLYCVTIEGQDSFFSLCFVVVVGQLV